jgi:hypothetical protein
MVAADHMSQGLFRVPLEVFEAEHQQAANLRFSQVLFIGR